MAAVSTPFAVGTTALVLDGTDKPGWIMVNLSTNVVYIGGLGVTTATGFPIQAGMYYSPSDATHELLPGNAGDARVYAIAAGAGNDVRVFVPFV